MRARHSFWDFIFNCAQLFNNASSRLLKNFERGLAMLTFSQNPGVKALLCKAFTPGFVKLASLTQADVRYTIYLMG